MITVRFTQSLFSGSEIKGFVMVNIELVSGTSASLFNVTVTPLQQTPASAKGNNILFYTNRNVFVTNRWC